MPDEAKARELRATEIARSAALDAVLRLAESNEDASWEQVTDAAMEAAVPLILAERPSLLDAPGDPLPAEQVTVSRAESERLRNGARALGATLTGMSRSMEAARIEMLQNGPAAAMEWILGALPDVSDAEPGDDRALTQAYERLALVANTVPS